MAATIPELNRKPGVCYALTDDGLELPVIDITHPAFAFEISDTETGALIDAFVASTQRLATLDPAVLKGMIQSSRLMRGMLVDSAGTYTSGMTCYLHKLGPDNLGDGYAGPVDRQWAGSLTPVTFRWRMRDVVHLLADRLTSPLRTHPEASLHLLNIGGGPAADSLNTLLVLHREHPELLAGRRIILTVFDLDREGPSFGARALAALLAEDAPLQGLNVAFHDVEYDWSKPEALERWLHEHPLSEAVAAGSTEGGLFEFARDEDITANLSVLREGTPEEFVMVGPVVRDASTLDPRLKDTENIKGRPAIRYLGLTAFAALASQAGWQIARHLDGPMHQVVCLEKRLAVGG
ncbi:MAG: hypothetical protein IT326_03825 [Anaerolineae bacterium]|nr:hypothetical protein [Anaerolineae bacterium]